MAESKKKQEKTQALEEIVRIMGQDVDGSKNIVNGITKIQGVSHSFANAVVSVSKLDKNMKAGKLTEEQVEKLEKIIRNPQKYEISKWIYNRQKSPTSGNDVHLVEADLEVSEKFDIRRMKKIKNYKGIRHRKGLPVRGQKTKTSFRGGARIGVSRKRIKKEKEKSEKSEGGEE